MRGRIGILFRRILSIINGRGKQSKALRTGLYAAGAIMIFFVTYMMILPAITIEKETAINEPGMNIAGQSVRESDATATSGDLLLGEDDIQTESKMQQDSNTAANGAIDNNANTDTNEQVVDHNIVDNDPQDVDTDSGKDKTPISTDNNTNNTGDDHRDSTGSAGDDKDKKDNNKKDTYTDNNQENNEDNNQNDGTDTGNPGLDSYTLITDPTTLIWERDDYQISAYIDEYAMLPQGVSLQVKEIRKNVKKEKKEYQGYYDKALKEINKIDGNEKDDPRESFAYARFFDISFIKDGKEIEPAFPIDITITLDQSKKRTVVEGVDAADLKEKDRIRVVHFDESDKKTKVEEVFNDSVKDKKKKNIDIQFEGETFSVYGIVYTVDFLYEVDGKSYEFSLPGGGYASFTDLIEVLGVAGTSENADSKKNKDDDGDNKAESAPLTLADVEVSDETKEFVEDVESLAFSSPELLSVVKVNKDATVGAIKDGLKLECEYSAELTKDQIKKINDQSVEAGDWALISLKPFTSEETLTVTMQDGEVFVIQVTDAQIFANVLTADGEHFRITVTYDELARIPEGSVLAAKEITEGSDKYEKYLEETEEKWEKDDREGYISLARFFDIEIQKDGRKIEPEAPVEVEIVHDEGFVSSKDESLSVIHFAENGTEIIDEVQRSKDNTQIVYEQDSFSVIGTVSTVKESGWPTSNGQYVLVLQDGDDYYALKQDGTLAKVRYFNNTVSFIGEGTTTTDYINDYLWYVQSNSGANASGRVSDKYYENGSSVGDQMFIVPTNDGWLMNAARQIRFNPTERKLYYTYYNVSRTLSAHDGQLSVVNLNDSTASPVFFASASSFTANDNETDLFTQVEVESIINKWKEQKTQEATYDKTAEVYDYENRVYQVDITASSSDYEVAPSIALEFVVDASRSMFYPTKIKECGTLSANSNTALQNWLNENGDINKTYFVVNNPNTDATQIALFYNPAETKHWYKNGSWNYYEGEPYGVWEWADAGNYNPPDGEKNIGNVLDRWSFNNLDLKVYETDMLSYSYEENYGTRGTYVSRIEYLKQCVRVASQVIYAVDDNAQIGLIGFNAGVRDYGTYGKSEQQTLFNKIDEISLAGGTDQEGGLEKAVSKLTDPANADKYAGHKQVVVLVTDGAPNHTYSDYDESRTTPEAHKIDWTSIGKVAKKLKGLKDDFGDDTELYTMGLSLSNVGTNQGGLFGISSGTGYTYAAEDAAQIINAVTKMVDGIFVQANLVADVKDVIDPAFYPVNRADGLPLEENDWINLNGGKVNAGANEAAGQVKKDADTGNWYVEWKDQHIDWPTTDSNGAITSPGWHGTVYVKAKEDFLGGNGISTNAEGSQLEAKKFVVRGDTTEQELPNGNHTISFQTPYVNIDELDITQNDTEWTVYLGTDVDPVKELKALWEKVMVKEVVTKTDSDHRISSDGQLTYQYASNTNDNRTEVNGREEFPITDLEGLTLTAADWADLIAEKSKIIDYKAYDHSKVGTIMISLKQEVKEGETNLSKSPHDTSVTGDEVEKYTLTVSYRPAGANISDWHTGSYGSGMSGSRAGNILKNNTHIINVYVKGLQITKVDLHDQILPGAKFTLYRTARDGETTDLMTIDDNQYYKVADLDTSSTGIAVKEQIEQLEEGEQYYLVETQVPAGYIAISPIPVNLSISDVYTPKPGTATQSTKPESGIFDWEQRTLLILDAESVKQTNADNTVDLTHSGTANSNNETIYYRITNNPGVELPHTGGPGTGIFTILGLILIAGAGLLLLRRRSLI